MSNFVIEIKAPELAGAMEKLAAALMNKTAAERGMDGCAPVNAPAPAPVPAANPTPTPVTASAPAPTPVMAPAPVNPPAHAPVQAPAAAAPTYTLDVLARAAADLMPGKMTELTTLLAQYGVDRLDRLPAEHYGSFATAIRGMGARI